MTYAVTYVVWIPLQPWFTWWLAAGAERLLRLVERPPLITSVVPSGNIITISSYVTGFDSPMASWNDVNIHFFVVAPIALMLAVPLRSLTARLRLALVAALAASAVSLGICVVQLETVAETFARMYLDIQVHTARERAILDWINQALITVGMLLVPAFLFLVTYLAFWLEPQTTRRDKPGPFARRPASPRTPARTAVLAAGGIAGAASIVLFLLATRPSSDPRAYLEGWAKLAALNPRFAPAHVNVGIGLEEAGRLDEAIEAYRRALQIDPERTVAQYNLGGALVKKGVYSEAAGAYQKVLDKEPAHAGAHKNLGIALLYLSRPCEALPHFERSTEIDQALHADVRLAHQIDSLRAACNTK